MYFAGLKGKREEAVTRKKFNASSSKLAESAVWSSLKTFNSKSCLSDLSFLPSFRVIFCQCYQCRCLSDHIGLVFTKMDCDL